MQAELKYSPWGVGLISAPIKNQAGQTNNDTLLIPDLQKRFEERDLTTNCIIPLQFEYFLY